MAFEIAMPQLGLTMETGTIVEWLVGEGDLFSQGQEIYQVETDKSIVAVEAHQEGNLVRIVVPAGREVDVGTVLAVAVAAGERLPTGWEPEQPASLGATPEPHAVTPPASQVERAKAGGLQVSWKARALAKEAGLDQTQSRSGECEKSCPRGWAAAHARPRG
jgi:pyruvate dehydrogenase E2 component (dihydrolipoamide acetyltransferase)